LLIGAVWAVSLTQLRLQDMNDRGLISVMPKLTLVCLGLLAISFAISLRRQPLNQAATATHVLVLIVVLYGITAFIEPVPRFSSVYKHVGIIQVLQLHSSINPKIDAYFNWPAFFALGDLLVKLAGWRNALPLAPWGPLLYNLLFLPPLLIIFRWATDDARLKWLAVWVFFSANWVGQDYISPQATAFLLWLAVLALLLRHFTPSPRWLPAAQPLGETLRQFGRKALRRRGAASKSRAAGRDAGVLVLVLLMYVAIVAGHELTPVPAIVAITSLAVFAGLITRTLPALAILILLAWLGFVATDYLQGHVNLLVQPLQNPGGSVAQSTSGRVSGNAQHKLITELSIVFSAAIWLVAVCGFIRRLRAGRLELAYVIIGLSPFVLPVIQPYGGEIFLRVFLFALPAVAFFVACAFFPSTAHGRTWIASAALALVLCAMLYGFQYPRYGNERFANFTRVDRATVQALYRLAPTGSVLIPGAANLPWQYRGYHAYVYRNGVDDLPQWSAVQPDVHLLVDQLLRSVGRRGAYFVYTPSEEIFAESFEGEPTNVLPQVIETLRNSPNAKLLYDRDGGQVFFLRPTSARSSPPQSATHPGSP
jgi:hypothetical protein